MSSLFCHYHPDSSLIEDNRAGDIICPECGTVVGDRLVDVGTEWRTFNDARSVTDPSRIGAPENSLYGLNNLATTFKSGFGASESVQGLANAQSRNVNPLDKQLFQAIETIRDYSERVYATKPIQDLAAKIFKQLLDNKTLPRQSSDAKAAACLYFACRKEGVPRTYEEIRAVSNVSKKNLGKCVTTLYDLLKTHFDAPNGSEFVSRFCGNLNLHISIQTAATRIAQKSEELNLVTGRSPVSLAAAAIYMASQASADKRTVKDICEITGAGVATIRQVYKLMLPRANELFLDNFNFVTSVEGLPKC
uniref:Transcription initiation factor IIB n=1 Tax=Panagrolaimus sp. ES5 TaxID=591445 RepID=A0AC34GX72_9BILA